MPASVLTIAGALRKRLRLCAAAMLFATLAACQVTGPGAGPRVSGETVDVALLLPYGSSNAGDAFIASSIENAARLAMADLAGVTVNLRTYDTMGLPSQAATVADQAVREGADVILGPLRSDAAAAVGIAVSGSGVNVLSFSNNSEIAGGNVFVLGYTFDNTARRIMDYAADRGRSQVVVVHAQNLSGEVARDAALRAAAFAGATVTRTVSYEFSQSGVVDALPAITSAVRETGANALLLTSDATGALPLFAQLLPENGIDTEAVRFMGLTRWDTPAQTLELSGLQGGWFALPDPDAAARFRARYEAAHGAPPHVLAPLGYDAVIAVGQTAATSGRLGAAELTATGFNGANGVFRLNADGTNQRAMAIAQVQDNQVTIIDPAPGGLAGPGL